MLAVTQEGGFLATLQASVLPGLFVWSWGPGDASVVEGPLVCSVSGSRGHWSSRKASINLKPNFPNFMVDDTEAQRG